MTPERTRFSLLRGRLPARSRSHGRRWPPGPPLPRKQTSTTRSSSRPSGAQLAGGFAGGRHGSPRTRSSARASSGSKTSCPGAGHERREYGRSRRHPGQHPRLNGARDGEINYALVVDGVVHDRPLGPEPRVEQCLADRGAEGPAERAVRTQRGRRCHRDHDQEAAVPLRGGVEGTPAKTAPTC